MQHNSENRKEKNAHVMNRNYFVFSKWSLESGQRGNIESL